MGVGSSVLHVMVNNDQRFVIYTHTHTHTHTHTQMGVGSSVLRVMVNNNQRFVIYTRTRARAHTHTHTHTHILTYRCGVLRVVINHENNCHIDNDENKKTKAEANR
jgi:hypothetical protein